jgi:hypothetical protein
MSPGIKSSADTHNRVRRRALAMALVAAAGIGGLSFGLGGVAGATSSPSSSLQSQATSVNKGFAEVLRHFNCGTAEARLGRVARLDAQFSKRYGDLTTHMNAAQKAGHAKRAKFLDKRLTAAHKEQGLLMGKKFVAQESRVAKLAQQKCHITPPPGT